MSENNERPVCHRAEDLVTYLYGEASHTDALDFRNHLQGCESCRSEFTVFNQVHQSIAGWRDEALGAAFRPAEITTTPAIEATEFVRHERKLSGVAALREFFSVSPLWLRGATAVAAVLLIVLGVLMVSRWSQKPVVVANKNSDEETFTRQQMQTEIKKAVDEKVRELTVSTQNSSVVDRKEKPAPSASRVQVAVVRQPKTQRQRLTPQEREQLAADLRLTIPAEEEETVFTFPEQEHPN